MPDGSLQSVYVARQPIVDTTGQVVGFEILFRNDSSDRDATITDAQGATAQVLVEGIMLGGLTSLTGGGSAWINASGELLKSGVLAVLSPPSAFVIEVLEDVVADAEAIAACHALRKAGLRLALDDVVTPDRIAAFAGAVSIVKIDFRAVTRAGFVAILSAARRAGLQVLAEKVETEEELAFVTEAGADLIQGYATGRPITLRRSTVAGSPVTLMQLLDVACSDDFDFGAFERVVTSDPSLAFKLLTFANSAAAAQVNRVSSVRQTMVLLGEKELRRIALLMFLGAISRPGTQHLLQRALVRGLFSESIAVQTSCHGAQGSYFLAGVLSGLDPLIEEGIAGILAQAPVNDTIRDGILSRVGPLGLAIDLVERYDEAAWSAVDERAKALGLHHEAVPPLYRGAVLRAHTLL